MTFAIIDANINRVSEGLRVIEDYVRFVAQHQDLTHKLATFRHQLNQTEVHFEAHLMSRDTEKDQRAKATPTKRVDIRTLLKANFKRVQEGLRVLEEYTGNIRYTHLRYDAYMLEKDVLLTCIKPSLKKGFYLISPDIEVLLQGLVWGVACVQLRDKGATKETLYRKAMAFQEKKTRSDIPFIVNDYLDIALLVEADGVHTGQDDISVAELRKLMGAHKLIGRTTHTLEQGKLAVSQGADYVSVGPIWETPSKPGRAGIGLDYLKQAHTLGAPFVAIGGVDSNTIHEIMPYSPPMVGLIRDYKAIPELMSLFSK